MEIVGSFFYTPPTGYLAICTKNLGEFWYMPRPTIENGEEYFLSIIYSEMDSQRVGKFVPFTDSGTIGNSCIFDQSTSDKEY